MTEIFNRFRDREKRQQLRQIMPRPEAILWSQLQGKRLDGHKFRRQSSIGRYVVDFYCPRARLVVELDGETHSRQESKQYDRIRDEYMRSLGLKVLRFKNDVVRENLSSVLRTIRRTLV